jgi:septum formation inhibitor-activating ATPase MinD
MTRTIAVANQKGGVAKTTTVATLGRPSSIGVNGCCSSTSTRRPA